MTPPVDGFERDISSWMHGDAELRVPPHLDAVLQRTRSERQRLAWSSFTRWLPMETTFRSRIAPVSSLAWAAVLGLLLLMTAIVVLSAGSSDRTPPTLHAMANGETVFVDGDRLMASAADGTNVRSLMTLSGEIEHLTFSPDGTRFAYRSVDGVPSIVVADADGSNPVVIIESEALRIGEPIAWSPDGRRLASTTVDARGILTIELIDADGTDRDRLFDGADATSADRFAPAWSPDGRWISYLSSEPNGYITLNVARPDGSGATLLATSPLNPADQTQAWSPDPAEPRLVYVAGGYVKVWDLMAATEHTVGVGYWPTWAPDGRRIAWFGDGTQVAAMDDILVGRDRATWLFPGLRPCFDQRVDAVKAICGPAAWSPDGRWVYGPADDGTSIIIAASDGAGPTRTIPVEHPVEIADVTWQPIEP